MSDLRTDLASLKIDRSAPKRRSKALVWLVSLSLVAGAAAAANEYGRPYLEAQVFKTEVLVTEISSVSPSQASVDLTSTGYVVPQLTARVGAKVVGRIAKVNVKEGSVVKAGDVLFELDAADETATVAAARARSVASAARVGTIKSQRLEIEIELKRQRQLLEGGAIGKSVVDDLEAKLKSLDAQIKAAEAETVAAGAETSSLTTGLKNLSVLAPIDGVVASKPAGVGDITNPAVPLAELFDMKSLLVEADVSEARLSLVRPGGPCEIALDAFPSERFKGEVVELGPRLNRAKATALVKVRFEKPPAGLRPEMSARVSFLQKALDEALLKEPPKVIVPAAALLDRNGGKAVFVVEGNKVRLTPVSVGEAFGTGFVLESGPPPGTRVVKDPPAELGDGQAIKEKAAS